MKKLVINTVYFFDKICAHDIAVMIWTDKIINSKNVPQIFYFG